MKPLNIFTLKALRKVYTKVFGVQPVSKPTCEQDPNKVSQLIYNQLVSDKPCMIARFGAFELSTVVNYLGVKSQNRNLRQYIKGESLQWWWNENTLSHMQNNAGFFPLTEDKIQQFCELMLKDMKEVDVLGSWLPNEQYFTSSLKNMELVQREIQNPFFAKQPWTFALKGKKVLVIHPFAELIEQQYQHHRLQLFDNQDILPEFKLQTITAVQSLGGKHEKFSTWFEALQSMKDEMDKRDYDICLIGAGAYGFPLAAHAKRQGKKAVHLGGSLQLLFGIKGKRWEDPNYNEKYNYAALMNHCWVRPGEKFRPKNAENVEGACYW
ncbi:DUF1792 domain-containing protein [Zobellia roscoffensis]|uniref:hypothetical protein n=1 Tax=Zobellia roscoffensis TaxID=2779508 RepID=UPI00188C3A62|nr:hypothetical protein [Zobellia roscoffensis]